jgi:hypothetical protein
MKMTTSEEKLLAETINSANKGISHRVDATQKKDAESLVNKGLCFWSLDYEHITVYDLH